MDPMSQETAPPPTAPPQTAPPRPADPPVPAAAAPYTHEPVVFVPLLLVLALAAGAAVSWAVHERRGSAHVQSRLQTIAKDAAFIEARADHLATLLLDPATELVHLKGAGPAAGRTAVVAWNPRSGEGVVLVDAADATPLRLLAGSDHQDPVQLLRFTPSAAAGHAFRHPGPPAGKTPAFTIESVPAPGDPSPSLRFGPL